MAEAAAPQRYPSPRENVLPFYQPPQSQRQRSQSQEADEQQQHQHVGPPMAHESSQQPHAAGDHMRRSDPDDPQLRQNLNNMMNSFSGYPASGPQAHLHNTGSSGLPPGSVTYAQAPVSSDATPPNPVRQKERTKVSRACDECRRKKIRCDAVDETGVTPCSNCARTGAKCAFSRQPQKRGPSKGYIKELAERLNTLESQVQSPNMQQQTRYEIQQVQQAMAAEGYGRDGHLLLEPRIGDKRTHDVAEGFHNGHSQVQQSAPIAPMQLPSFNGESPSASHFATTPLYLSQQQFQQPGAPQPFWQRGGAMNRQEVLGQPYDGSDTNSAVLSFEWDESVVDEYYRIIHQTFPLLPNSKNSLRQRLADCPVSLRDAFLAALECLMRTFPTTTLVPNQSYPQVLKKAAELLARYPFDNPSAHTGANNLVYLQTLLIMALESDNHGPASIKGQAGPSRGEWLGRAAGVAGQLEINVIRKASTSILEGDRDSEERLARRVWWVLFILDRWHASSTADLLKLPENSVVLLPEDQILLGESTYHLARLSFIIGHLAAILTTTKTPSTDVMAPSNPASSLLGLTLAGEIDRFRESVESVWGSLNLVHLSYHHCHLLIKRLNPQTEPTELVGHAVKVATVLNSRLTPVTPLNHHFGALAGMTLCELCDLPKTRVEAFKGLEQLSEALGEGRGLAGKQDSDGWDGAIRDLVMRKKERMMQEGNGGGLQGLADAAAGSTASFDPTMLTRYGYLAALGQGMFKTT